MRHLCDAHGQVLSLLAFSLKAIYGREIEREGRRMGWGEERWVGVAPGLADGVAMIK
jgi:hypothetical protein